jgi:predicted metal-dependent phosphoesterase TrpH
MRIDLHIHSKDGSDGRFTLHEIMEEARRREIDLISITDHDSIECQETGRIIAEQCGLAYLTGVELSITFSHPGYRNNKPVSLDVLGYQFDAQNEALARKLKELKAYRRTRAKEILRRINGELEAKDFPPFTETDLAAIEQGVDGAFGRPHIADFMVKKGLVAHRQEAFDSYLVKCNVPKLPLSLEEASALIRGAGGRLMLAHPNDPNGTSLASLTSSIPEQHEIVKESMVQHLDGIECWHSRHSPETTAAYLSLARQLDLMVTGGSDCHQQPVMMGTVDVPTFVAEQFAL